jgi:predicted metallo-beta-lactamase superfamily hydrolase
MRSEFTEWLDQMQHVADADNVTVAARHFDVLDYYFKSKKTPEEAYQDYTKFLKRWNALTNSGQNTEACS